MKNNKVLKEIKLIKLSLLENNTGQIPNVPQNPRQITDKNFANLKQSIIDSPEMLELKELIVYPYQDKLVIICGNMRFKALKELGYTETICKVLVPEVSADKLQEYLIKDNMEYGQLDYDIIANEWSVEKLTDWGLNLPDLDTKELKPEEECELKQFYKLEIECSCERELQNLYEEIQQRGFECRILTF